MFPLKSYVFLPWILTAWAAADPVCDPRTQYLRNGECCQLCRPGTSMKSSDCRKPECQECEENDYTASYNRDSVCEKQPYCDPNQNFIYPERMSKTERHQCQCSPGFHCSSFSCISCVPHTDCGPGSGAKITGGQTKDTVCEKCPPGFFSNETSWSSSCKKLTECPAGYEPQGGSTESDQECVFSRGHIGVICGVLVLLLAGVGIFIYHKWKRQTGHVPLIKQAVAGGSNSGLYEDRAVKEEEEEEEKEPPFITNPTDDRDTGECLVHPAQESSAPEYSVLSVAEESEYLPTITANGDVLSPDQKEHIVPIEETGGSQFQAI